MIRRLCFLFSFVLLISGGTAVSAAVIVPANGPGPTPTSVEVKSAVDAFHALSKKERKAKIKDVKKEIRAFLAAKKAGQEPSTNTLLLVILAILLPPLAVYLYEGEITTHFWISLLLTLLFYLPGIIYALILILGNK